MLMCNLAQCIVYANCRCRCSCQLLLRLPLLLQLPIIIAKHNVENILCFAHRTFNLHIKAILWTLVWSGRKSVEQLDGEEDEHEEVRDDALRFGFPCPISTGEDHPGRIQLDGGNLLLLRLRRATETHVIALALEILKLLQGMPVELEIAVSKMCRIFVELHKSTAAPKTDGFRFYF